VVIAQIEEPAGVAAAAAIAATEGIDGLFVGPADLTVAYGHADQTNADLAAGYAAVAAACTAAGKAQVTWVPDPARGRALRAAHGVQMLFVASDLTFLLREARATAAALAG
jgi:2-keto-3-deoxy-L-rhamnonate aldolase RhmA